MNKTEKPKDVDAYISAAPKEVRAKLKELRTLIRKTAPTAVERISYGMPYYSYKGRGVQPEDAGIFAAPGCLAVLQERRCRERSSF